jgi:adenine C2-methylase RlmN of 23S rRNA A2503 and tRNA A37
MRHDDTHAPSGRAAAPLVLTSALDLSVNFVAEAADGKIESRYVRREDEYFIAYLSSQTGCNKSCRFCHLTATGQTGFSHVDAAGFAEQAETVLRHYDHMVSSGLQPPARRLNFNWMARGEPLANPHMLEDFPAIAARLAGQAEARGLEPRHNISTIMPEELRGRSLARLLGETPSTIYYSLYSLEERFRKRWLPKGLPPAEALDMLARYQQETAREIVFHWAFIEGENDDEQTVGAIAEAVRAHGLWGRFNLVRYNPASPRQGQEPPEPVLSRNLAILAGALGSPLSRIVPRVGFDVKASCGMFV